MNTNKETSMPKYELTEDQKKDLENRYVYHAPKGDQQERYILLRGTAKLLAKTIMECTPKSRDQSIALTKLEECVMRANAAIAVNE